MVQGIKHTSKSMYWFMTLTEVDASAVFVESGVHCDPSVAKLNDGSYGMVLKHIRAQDMTQPRQ